MCRKLVNLINSHVSHCKRQKWPPVSEHNLSSRFHFSWFIGPVLNLICDSFINLFFQLENWCVRVWEIIPPSLTVILPNQSFSRRRKLWCGGGTLCFQLWAHALNSASSVNCALLQHCWISSELCHWIVITGVCRTVSLVLAWRYVSDAPTILHCRLSTGRP